VILCIKPNSYGRCGGQPITGQKYGQGFNGKGDVENESAVAGNELSRREFLWLAMMSSAMVMGAGSVMEEEQPTSHAQLRALAPDVTRPEGWLRGMLEKQVAQLALEAAASLMAVSIGRHNSARLRRPATSTR
jgi:hypothetical protein